jgi:Uncharacterized conserved protein related to C-terminal domain of eukaryotic chaperone, SACSIN
MKRDVVIRWVKKAESDLRSANVLLKADDVITESVCFHCQQAIEKYLKAFLTEKNVRFGKIHDLLTLIEMCIREDKEFEKLDKDRISELTFYAVDVRYPDEFYTPSLEEAKKAFEIAKQVKDFIFKKLNITEKDIL